MHFKNKKRATEFWLLVSTILIIMGAIIMIISKIGFRKEMTKKVSPLDEYVLKYNTDEIVYNADFNQKVTSIVTFKDGRYEAQLFDYTKKTKLNWEDVIKKNKLTAFKEKINTLLELKYPKFIADALKEAIDTHYCFMAKALIIYYYDVKTDPMVKEDLFLTVNYNEIAEYLDFPVPLDTEYTNEDAYTIDPNKKHIAITFDDGPSKYNEELVDILNDNKVHATFFFVGRLLSSRAEAVKKAFASGHEIGYHSYAHANLTRQSTVTIKNEFAESNAKLRTIINQDFTLIRPPYGSVNKTVKNSLDLPFILWNVDTNDWRYRDTDYLVNYCLENISDGDIILFHDSYATSIEAIRRLLPILYTEGYQMLTVSDLAKLKGKTLENHTSYYSFK